MRQPGATERRTAAPPDRPPEERLVGYRPRPFRPAWWLPGGHGQTLGARLLRSRCSVRYRRRRIETPDGDFLDLDFAVPTQGQTGSGTPGETGGPGDGAVVLVLHGLEGCSSSGYVVRLCRKLAGRGLEPVAMNFRSRSGEPNRRARSYHAGASDDLARVIDWLTARDLRRPLAAVGFSLGGNVLLKYLGERPREASHRLRAAAALSVPFDLARSADRMDRGLARLYSRHFLRSLQASLRRKARRFPDAFDVERGLAARTIREFDDAITAPVHGFRNAAHYYGRSSSARYLNAIRVPTLILHALDDPLVPAATVPLQEIRGSPWLVDGVQPRGGHVGFVEGESPARARLWAESEAARFVAAAMERA